MSNNFSFVCKKFYVSRLLDEIGLRGTQSDTYKLVNKLKEKVIDENITFSSKFDLSFDKFNTSHFVITVALCNS